jgi:enamine deaminase RidA (YjgF/YER057c/UK114 family)
MGRVEAIPYKGEKMYQALNDIEGLRVTRRVMSDYTELFITAVPRVGQAVEVLLKETAEVLAAEEASIISQEIFGLSYSDTLLQETLGDVTWPVTWLEDGDGTGLCGTHVWAVSGVKVKSFKRNNTVVGCLFESAAARQFRIGGIVPSAADSSREDQAREIMETMEAVLKQANMDMLNVVRTWFYNDDILDWYGGFNKTRDVFWEERKIFEGLLPASTGIGARNSSGMALVAGALAVQAKVDTVQAVELDSPLQGSAREYGSSFSRATEVAFPDHRSIYVSGSASIEPNGATIHLDDIEGQVQQTMDVIHAILTSRCMDWTDVTRATAYCLKAEYAPVFTRYCTEQGLPPLPWLITNNVVCRHDLLFEIELDAVQTMCK